jgi:hypothetical protein
LSGARERFQVVHRATVALYAVCAVAAILLLLSAPDALGPPLLQGQCVVVACVTASANRTRFTRAAAGVIMVVAFVLAAAVHVQLGRVIASRWTCGFDPAPMVTVLNRILGVLAFAFIAATAAFALREALSRSARVSRLLTLSLILAAAAATIRTGARAATAPNWDAYVEAMPVVATLPEEDPVLSSDEPIDVAGITVRRRGGGLEIVIDGSTWKADFARECHIVGNERTRIRHDAIERLWVVENDRGTRCPFDETTHSDGALTRGRVAGSASAPVGWTVTSLIALACALLLLMRARVTVPSHRELGPYRTAASERENRAPPLMLLAFSLALIAISLLVWIQ